jgi:hypothetical protein
MALAILPEPKPNEEAMRLFMRELGASPAVAAKLAMELTSIEEVAYAPMEELLIDTGLDEPALKALRTKARLLLIPT